MNKKEYIYLGVFLAVVFVAYVIYKRLSMRPKPKQTKVDSSQVGISEQEAKGYVMRLINDASFWGKDNQVYLDLQNLNNEELKFVNNAYVKYFSTDFGNEYDNIAQFIRGENAYLTDEMNALIIRLETLF